MVGWFLVLFRFTMHPVQARIRTYLSKLIRNEVASTFLDSTRVQACPVQDERLSVRLRMRASASSSNAQSSSASSNFPTPGSSNADALAEGMIAP